MKEKNLNIVIALLGVGIAILSYLYKSDEVKIILCIIGIILFLTFIVLTFKNDEEEEEKIYTTETELQNRVLSNQITEIALLNEENTPITYWQMYGKTSLVIGLDTGENNVNINLLNTTYASTIDREHAILNYSGGRWYIEDNDSDNGISVVKSDGRKYKLNNSKPCLVEKGDIIYISLAKLKLS